MYNATTMEKLFLSVCSDTLRAHDGFDIRGELGTYSAAMVVWLGITKRLTSTSLSQALAALAQQLEHTDLNAFVDRPSQKLRDRNMSLHTGGLSRAQQRMPEEMLQELFLHSGKEIEAHYQKQQELSVPNVYMLDGMVLTTARTNATMECYGTVKNRKKTLHYPRVRCVAAHRIDTGVCASMTIGAYTDHESVLARQVLEQLPPDSIVVEDRGFSAPGLLAYAQERGIKSIVRLKDTVGKKLLKLQGQQPSFLWESYSSIDDKEVTIEGRIVHVENNVPGFRTSTLYLFTNSSLSDEKIAELYRQRVQVETAIRYIKQTLRLAFVTARTPEAIRKEIYTAYLTFNLVRAIMYDIASVGGIAVNRLSFTKTISFIVAYGPVLLSAKTKDVPAILGRFRKYILQCKNPLRKKPRSYPREVKMPRGKYPLASTVELVNQEKGK